MLQLIHNVKLQIKTRKCKFFQRSLKFLGHEISKDGIKTDPDKIKAMNEIKPPRDVKGVQSLLGFFNYYQKFIPSFSKIAQPIYKLLTKDSVWEWDLD